MECHSWVFEEGPLEFHVEICPYETFKKAQLIGKMLVPLGWYPSCLTPQGAV